MGTMSAEPASTRKRGPYRKTDARRREIIAAALDVFSVAGYRGGSLKEIADLIGTTPSTILHHFSTKEELLQAVLDDKVAQDFGGVHPGFETEPAAIPQRMIELAERNDGLPGVIALYAVLSAESTTAGHPSTEYFRERSERSRRDFRAAFQAMADVDLLAPGVSVDYAAVSTFAIWDGIQLHWLIEPTAVSVVDTLREHLRQITRVTDV
jgi:AcrR family transcriptional regulator